MRAVSDGSGDYPALVLMDPNARVPPGNPGEGTVRCERMRSAGFSREFAGARPTRGAGNCASNPRQAAPAERPSEADATAAPWGLVAQFPAPLKGPAGPQDVSWGPAVRTDEAI
ncbi:hypothetical protein GCM10017557_55210 [Streptomyces aurantiacus]|uniref:Uncharacterized protein n=1 Tax=Streptomyces aurantiacus TaxID=47760 RepID=A0A7G1P6I6_9ACTN|nr:hypothetical protein GCM10017557_55210 [Streptomyces aurantiacus]